MIASVVLATRGRAASVWLGGAAAFAVHVVIATTLGVVMFRLLPRQAVEVGVAVIFLAGAVLTGREALRSRGSAGSGAAPVPPAGRRAAATAFAVIFIAEWGDLTQVLIANL